MGRSCGHTDRSHIASDGSWKLGECVCCWHYYHSEDYRRLEDGEPPLPPKQPISLNCTYRGEKLGEEECPSCGCNPDGKAKTTVFTFACSCPRVFERKCTVLKPVAGFACCAKCQFRVEPAPEIEETATQTPMEWITTEQLATDTLKLIPQLPPDIGGVAGIPRSGMMPAALLATHLHVPLFELNGVLRPLGTGSRSNGMRLDKGTLLVVDDTVYAGNAMRKARDVLGQYRAAFASVYARPEAVKSVDLYACLLPCPHLLEWNLVNNGPFYGQSARPELYRDGIGVDLDGVLCHDSHSGGLLGTPYLLPRMGPCPLIATGRKERDRGVTEEWLAKWGVKFLRLEMMPDGYGRSGDSWEAIASFKSSILNSSSLGMFIESDPEQAQRINELTGKPVICPRIKKVFQCQ